VKNYDLAEALKIIVARDDEIIQLRAAVLALYNNWPFVAGKIVRDLCQKHPIIHAVYDAEFVYDAEAEFEQ
jgi:hypothetical protein